MRNEVLAIYCKHDVRNAFQTEALGCLHYSLLVDECDIHGVVIFKSQLMPEMHDLVAVVELSMAEEHKPRLVYFFKVLVELIMSTDLDHVLTTIRTFACVERLTVLVLLWVALGLSKMMNYATHCVREGVRKRKRNSKRSFHI